MSKRATLDHGEIIHFAGAHHLFPVARKDEVRSDELRVGWPAYFEPFNPRALGFLIDGDEGRAVTRREAEEAGAALSAH